MILDNADRIASLCGKLIEGWLERCVELQVVVTSLGPLGAQGEQILDLQPLDPQDAVELYLDRANRASADRIFSAEELPEVEELVSRLDRLPLAIELAAARVRILPPRAMLSMFERRFEILHAATARRDDPSRAAKSRNSSLLGACEITWNHLEPHEQLALARAAVFEDGFTTEAAEEVLGEASLPQPVSEILDALSRKSLLHCDEAAPPRYSLLESIKEYALRELKLMGRWGEAKRRHADYFAREAAYFVDQGAPEVAGTERPDEAASLAWLRRERANVVAVHDRFAHSDPKLAATAGLALLPLIHWEGNPDPDSELPRSILASVEASQVPHLLLRAPSFIGRLHYQYGRFDRAAHFFEESIRQCRVLGDRAMEAKALSNHALALLGAGERERSRKSLEKASLLCEGLDQPGVEGEIRLAQGLEALQRGALDEAEVSYTKAVALLEPGRLGISANTRYGLGLTLANRRNFDEARRLIEEGLQECRALGYRAFEAHILTHLALIELADGDLDRAQAVCERSLTIHRESGNRFREGEGQCTLGVIALERDDLDGAEEWFGQAQKRFVECDAGANSTELLLFLAILEVKRDQIAEAQEMLDEVRAALRGGVRLLNPTSVELAQALVQVGSARQQRQSDPAAARALVGDARSYLADAAAGELRLPSYLPVFHRLLERSLAEWESGAPSPVRSRSRPSLLVGAQHDWFQASGGQRVSLRGRVILRRLFGSLVEARLERPGQAVTPHDLVDAVWPGVGMIPGRATKRLYMAMMLLRDLGLRANILTAEDGYLLDPEVPIRVEGEEERAAPSWTAEW